MTLTTDHPDSSDGIPVFVDSEGFSLSAKAGVRALRRELGLTQDTFGELLGLSGRSVAAYEQGWRIPSTKAYRTMRELIKRL